MIHFANTLQNIAKAQKEIDKLETEALATTSTNTIDIKDNTRKPTQKNEGVNGQEKDIVNDATVELEKAKIDDDDVES